MDDVIANYDEYMLKAQSGSPYVSTLDEELVFTIELLEKLESFYNALVRKWGDIGNIYCVWNGKGGNAFQSHQKFYFKRIFSIAESQTVNEIEIVNFKVLPKDSIIIQVEVILCNAGRGGFSNRVYFN